MESASQSSASLDVLSNFYSPADLASAPRPFSPRSYPVSRIVRSPAFVEAYLSGSEPKPIAQLSPSTPFQEFLNSSPAGYWQVDDSFSVSPISRHSDIPVGMDADADLINQAQSTTETAPSKNFGSLFKCGRAQGIPGSPARDKHLSSPSSLSSLSSVPSSPSVLSAGGLRMPSSQSSLAHTPSGSPVKGVSLLSPLGSPFKLTSENNAPSSSTSARRPRRPLPALRFPRRPLVADILNQPGRSRSGATASSSPIKLTCSPAAPVSDSDDENYEPPSGLRRRTRKRARLPMRSSPSHRQKRQRREHATLAPFVPVSVITSAFISDADDGDASETADARTYPNRTFPLRVPIHDHFPLFYRRFTISSVVDERLAMKSNLIVPKLNDAIPNEPRDLFDLYTPRFVKGKGTTKVGLCPICHETLERGGEGKKVWLSMKFSAFNYHMQYAHGISATTGRPFSPPIAFRTVQRHNAGKHEKSRLMEGKCHKCKKWVAVEGIKDVPSKVKEIFWWKHAAACHQGSTVDGESDVFVQDELYVAIAELHGATDEDAEGEDDAGREDVAGESD